MGVAELCLVLLAVPLTGACLAAVLGGRAREVVAVVSSFGSLVVTLLAGQKVSLGPAKLELARLPWLPGSGNFLGFLLDPLTFLMLLVITLIGFLVILYSVNYMSPANVEHPSTDGRGRYYFWMLFFICSMIGVAISPSFFQLFIFWELTTLCSWMLISFYQKEEKALKAGFKALIMTHVGGLFLMTAIVLLFINTGSFEFSALNQLSPALKTGVLVLILVAAWAKAAQVPFYTWLPDAMEAPTPVSAYLHAAAMVKAGVYLAARTLISSYPVGYPVGLMVAIMAMVTMAVGVFLFFYQDDLKRLLALSTITHLAYIFLALGLAVFGSTTALKGGLLHIAAHACGKGLLFLSVGALGYFTGSRKISELSGALSRLPLVGLAFFVGAFTVTGVPPFAGFWSKFLIITGALELGGVGTLFGVLLLIESVIAFAWFLWVGQKVFLGAPSPAVERASGRAPGMEIALVVLIILCLVIPLVALPIIGLIG